MNCLSGLLSIKRKKLILEPNFWIISFIILSIVFLYYSFEYNNLVFVDRVPWFQNIIIFEYSHDANCILLYIPFVYAALIFSLRNTIFIWSLSIIIMLPHIISFSPNANSLLTNLLYLLFPLMVIIFIMLEISWRDRFRKSMIERESERQAHMSQILRAQEDERKRIAMQLHDDTIQTLLVIANRVHSLLNVTSGTVDQKIERQIESINDDIIILIKDVKRLSVDLRPTILDNMGLMPALRWLADRVSDESSIDVKIEAGNNENGFDNETNLVLFRFIQEALNNIRKHSEASEAVINIEFEADSVKVAIKDNGKGFTVPKAMGILANEGKSGLIGMKEKALLLGGTFDIYSEVGKGTLVLLEFDRVNR